MHQSRDRWLPVPIPEMDPLLVSYLSHVQDRSTRARNTLNKNIQMVRDIIDPYYLEFEELCARINEVKIRIRMLQRGVAATESLAAPQRSTAFEDKTEAEKFVLKRAYRQAAALCHPDRGGSVQDFQSVYNAYLAGDLYALSNFVLARQKPNIEMIRHWLVDAERCSVAWREFQVSREFKIAQLVMRKQVDAAREFIRAGLDQQLRYHLAEERLLLLKKEVVQTEL